MDTNVLLTEARSFLNYKNNDIVIPYKVLEEIDKHKKRQDGVGVNARLTIRLLDEYREKGSLHRGVRIGKGMISGIPIVIGTRLYVQSESGDIAAFLMEQPESESQQVDNNKREES